MDVFRSKLSPTGLGMTYLNSHILHLRETGFQTRREHLPAVRSIERLRQEVLSPGEGCTCRPWSNEGFGRGGETMMSGGWELSPKISRILERYRNKVQTCQI